MRFRKLDRYLLVLAGLFVLAVLRRSDMPGEEMLPDLYRAAIHEPLVAQMAGAPSDADEVVSLRNELATAKQKIRMLEQQLSNRGELARYFRKLEWEAQPEAIPGWVFSVDTDNFRRNFRIDCGLGAGVGPGLPVVRGHALLGIVFRAASHHAFVRRVDDPAFRLEVEIETEGGVERGVATGDGDRGIDVRFVRQARVVKEGDAVFTTRYHRLIPPGLLVGRVAKVEDMDQNGILEVEVTPAALLGRLAQIEVLKRHPRR